MKYDKPLFFDPVFKRFEEVAHKSDLSRKLIVTGFCITGISENCEVLQYTVGCSSEGRTDWFFPEEVVVYDPAMQFIERSKESEK